MYLVGQVQPAKTPASMRCVLAMTSVAALVAVPVEERSACP